MDDEMSIEAARPKLGEIVDLARFNNIHTTITRQGKPAAVVVSVEFYEHAMNNRPRPRIRDTEE
jgi:prevent-host-death family protein